MIVFRKLRFKNFLSFGDQFTEIQLDRSPTTLIVGHNGAGKSTFLDALTFVLFNKPFRKINKPQMVNSINGKKALVEVEFEAGGYCYLVRRGIKPNVFEIFRHDSFTDIEEYMLPQDAANGDYQSHLEKNIMKMNYEAFTQVVILGKATYVPFMRLGTPARRAVIEDLLGLKIFGTMNKVLKDKMKSLKASLGDAEHTLNMLVDKIDNRQRYVDDMSRERDNRIAEIAEQIASIRAETDELTTKIDVATKKREELAEQVSDESALLSRVRKLEGLKAKASTKESALWKEQSFFEENEQCPTCTQPIDSVFRENRINTLNTTRNQLEEGMAKLEADLQAIDEQLDKIDELNSKVSLIDRKISELNSTVRSNHRNIDRLTVESEKLQNVSMEREQEVIDDLEKELKSVRGTRDELRETELYYKGILDMLKDDGIKTLIINKYLPVFNKLINQFLQKMGFMVRFTLDEEFNEQILSRYCDKFSYNNFSEGQKLRIDLAILMTWREVARMKNSLNTNLLIMDEVFDSSLDQEGVDAFMELLPMLGEGSNVFVVSHTPDKLYDKFRSQIMFTQEANFSTIAPAS